MTYGTHYVIDEAGAFFQREPTVAESIMNITRFTDAVNRRQPRSSPNMFWCGIEATSEAEARRQRQRMDLKARRTREQQNCLHGRRPYPVHWKPGTHPLGIKEFWVNIEGMAGGPYLLSEGDHDILHNLNKEHTHV